MDPLRDVRVVPRDHVYGRMTHEHANDLGAHAVGQKPRRVVVPQRVGAEPLDPRERPDPAKRAVEVVGRPPVRERRPEEPPVAFALLGKWVQAILSFLIMLLSVGFAWPIASIWACLVVSEAKADKRFERVTRAIRTK